MIEKIFPPHKEWGIYYNDSSEQIYVCRGTITRGAKKTNFHNPIKSLSLYRSRSSSSCLLGFSRAITTSHFLMSFYNKGCITLRSCWLNDSTFGYILPHLKIIGLNLIFLGKRMQHSGRHSQKSKLWCGWTWSDNEP